MGEGLVFSLLMLAMPVMAWLWPSVIWRSLVLDQLVFAVAAAACAWKLRRLDRTSVISVEGMEAPVADGGSEAVAGRRRVQAA